MVAAIDHTPDLADGEAAVRMERMLIGALLIDRDGVAAVVEWLKPGAFLNGECRQAYQAMLACWADRVPPDIATIEHGYRAIDVDFFDIPYGDLAGMMADCPFAVHAPHYARAVAEYARRRVIADLGVRMVQGAYRGGFDYETAYRDAMENIEALVPDEESVVGPRTYGELVPDLRERILRGWAGEIDRVETPLGFRNLDRSLRGGLRPGELCIIAGRPGMGKTAFGLQVLHNMARAHQHDHVMIFSNEMNAESLIWRAIAEVSNVAPEHVETGKIPDHVKNDLLNALAFLETLPVAIDDTGGITTEQMLMRIQRFQRSKRVRAVLFDYVELAGDRRAGEGDVERVNSIVRRLKQIATICGVSVIALSQLSRNVENRADKEPQLSDLRYGGEAAADQVLLLYRPEYYNSEDRPGECDVILAKQRNGITGKFGVRFHKEVMAFSDFGDTR
jgi:replicative DNA helicase